MGKKQHISRLAAPKTWPIVRKGMKWVAKPIAGPHNLDMSMPLLIYVRDLLKLVSRAKNATRMLDKIMINGVSVVDVKYPVGLFDVISVPSVNKYYRVILTGLGRLGLIEIRDDANIIPLKVVSKSVVKNGKLQLGFSNGWTLLNDIAGINLSAVKVRDTLLYDIKTSKIVKHLKLDKGNIVFVTSGTHVGKTAVLQDMKAEGALRKKYIALLVSGEERWHGDMDHVFVIGGSESEVKLQ